MGYATRRSAASDRWGRGSREELPHAAEPFAQRHHRMPLTWPGSSPIT